MRSYEAIKIKSGQMWNTNLWTAERFKYVFHSGV